MRYVGLDVHKRTVRACVLNERGEGVLEMSVACTRNDLLAFCSTHLRPDDQVAMEATTNVWSVAELIRPHVERVVVSNPLRTKAIAQAKVKTDKIDARVLAQLLRCDYLPEVWTPDERTQRLRQLTTARTMLMNDRTRIKNRIQSLLATRLIRCPYATLFAKRSIAWLSTLELDEADRCMLDAQLRLLAAVDRELKALDEQLQSWAEAEPDAKLLMTLPGVSHASALTLLAALGEVGRFRDGDHAASYLGLAPSTRQSGGRCYHGRITKAGNSHARWMLTQGVQHLAHEPGPLGAFFRRIARRKGRQVAVVAAARKLVVIAYLMLKHQEPYRYAKPETVRRKFNRLHRTAGRAPERASADLGQICRDGGLPSLRAYDELPAGERRMLAATGTADFARQIGQTADT